MTDWGSVVGGSSGGPARTGGRTNWGSVVPSAPSSTTKKSSGGSSFFGGLIHDVEHQVERIPGSNIASNVARWNFNEARDMGIGLYGTGQAFTQDTINHPASIFANILGPGIGGAIAASALSHLEGGHGTNVENKVAKPIAYNYKNKYSPVFWHPLTGKSYHGIENDPFGTALDIATIATAPFDFGTSLGIRAATLGVDVGRAAELTRIASLATKEERAAELAKLGDVTANQRLFVKLRATKNPIERSVLSEKDGREVPYTVKAGKTPYGRAFQKKLLDVRESAPIRDKPIIGANRIALKQEVQGLKDSTLAGETQLGHSSKAYGDLSHEEQRALHIIAEAPRGLDRSEWLATKVRSLEELLSEAKDPKVQKDLEQQLKNLGAHNPNRFEKIHDAIVNPSQKLQKAVEAARGDAQLIRENFPDLTEQQIMERIHGPAAVQGGARWADGTTRVEHVPGQDFHAEERAAAQAKADEATKRYTDARKKFDAAPRPESITPHPKLQTLQDHIAAMKNQLAHAEGASRQSLLDEIKTAEAHLARQTAGRAEKVRAAYQAAEQRMADARKAYKDAHDALHAVPGPERDTLRHVGTEPGLQGGPSIESLAKAPADPVHGDAFYFPHRGPELRSGGSFSSATSGMPLGQIKTAAGMKAWKAQRQIMGRYITSPDAWTRAGMASLRWKFAHTYQQWLIDTVAVDAAHLDHLPKGWSWLQPTSTKVARDVKERTALHDSLDNTRSGQAELEDSVNQMLPKGKARPQGDGPLYAVPDRYASAMRQEFQRTNTVFHNLFEKPMDVWRAAVLKWRPAWLINNIVGQHLLYWIRVEPGAAGAYFRALKGEKSGYYVDNVLGRLMHIPAFRNKYGAQIEDAGVYGVRRGFTQATIGDPRSDKFAATMRTKLSENHKNVYGTGRGVGKIISAFPRFTTAANQAIADDWPRLAKFQQEARKTGAAARVQAAQKALGEPITYLDKVLGGKEYDAKIAKEMTDAEKHAVIDKVDRALGNYTTLTPFERKYLRRFFPFYAWFKVIGAISKDLLIDSPLRVNIIYNLNKAAQQDPTLIPDSSLPSWLKGAISLGPTKNGVHPMLSTTGLNPFNTIPQLAQGLQGVVKPGANPSDSTGLLGPAFGAFDLYQGTDPFTGGKYSGAGANESPLFRALIGTIAGLPEVKVAQSHGYLGGSPPSKSYAPETHHVGPFSLNDTDLGFLGLPRKNVRVKKAKAYAKSGL